MANFVLIQSSGVAGLVRPKPELSVVVLGSTHSLGVGFSKVKATQSVECLFILAHGYVGDYMGSGPQFHTGGQGIELGIENIFHSNVAMWNAIEGVCKNIVVYSCAAAETTKNNVGTTADGKYLMGALAIAANAPVYAADKTQEYRLASGGVYVDLGDWEGNLFRFDPSGAPPKMVKEAPYDLGSFRSTWEKAKDAAY